MPDRKLARRCTLWGLILFNLLGGVLAVLGGAPGRRSSGRPSEPIWPKPIEPDAAHDPKSAFIDKSRPRSRRRFATSLAFVTLFFAGAAFSAGAGDVVVDLLESDEPAVEEVSADSSETVQPDAESEEPPADANETPTEGEEESGQEPVDSQPEVSDTEPESDGETEAESAGEPQDESDAESGDGDASEEPPTEEPEEAESSANSEEESDTDESVDETHSDDGAATDAGAEHTDLPVEAPAAEPQEDEAELPAPASSEAEAAAPEVEGTSTVEDSVDGPEENTETAESEEPEDEAPPLVKPKAKSKHDADPEPEIESDFATATVWLHRELPDPTPPARRLKWVFAKDLRSIAADNKVDWALVLAVLRAKGHHGSTPASEVELREIARSLVELGARKDEWAALLAYSGRTAFADRAQALARYNRAVGLRSLVRGLDAAKEDLADKVLGDPRIWIYAGGRTDIEAGRIDVRVLVLLLYLAEAHDQVTVSSLFTGHRLYARPGVISAHIYGLAVDIAALSGQSILGNSQPGGITEKAVRNILLLPAELQPQQVISLLGLGGPSFPLADHADHIHVGF